MPISGDYFMKIYFALLGALLLAACQQGDREVARKDRPAAEKVKPATAKFTFALVEGDVPPLPAELSTMPLQIHLSRLGFSPGVIDGKAGESLAIAVKGFQAANELPESGELDAATKATLDRMPQVAPTVRVTIPADFARQAFASELPDDAAAQAKLPALVYRSLIEALAERFHTTPETLLALNGPDMQLAAGATIIVPNIAEVSTDPISDAKLKERGWADTLASLGIAANQADVVRITVDKSGGWLRAYGDDDRIIVQFPVTMGSKHDPLPLGNWTVKGVARNPDYSFDPELLRNVKDSAAKQTLPPGPNSPVGVVWIDLSKPHYGIHGTPDPATIGRAESNGCVRLTNWDAAMLAQMVKPGVMVVFRA
jgi:lipoprotein-anchoring transpeptidase ErfK/SrfK